MEKMQFKGYDTKKMEMFYHSQFAQAKRIGKSDEEAHELANFFLDYYKHQFRLYR